MRILLAFACFFRLLFTGRLPARAAAYLPRDTTYPALGAAPVRPAIPATIPAPKRSAPEPTTPAIAPTRPPPKAAAPTPRVATKADPSSDHRDGALALLALLQREGRLVDFLRQSLDGHGDGDIGAAVRDIHRGCRKVIEEHFELEAVMPGEEDTAVKVPAGFDPGEVRLIGEIKGEPPFRGVLRHHGWRVTEVRFPTLTEGVDRRVVAPAEIEVAG
jgi:hypothetical protein